MSKWTIQDDDGSWVICVGGEEVFFFDPDRYEHLAEYVVNLVNGGCDHQWETITRCEICGRAAPVPAEEPKP